MGMSLLECVCNYVSIILHMCMLEWIGVFHKGVFVLCVHHNRSQLSSSPYL